MVDIHTHCLPEIDDGAKNIQESIEMLKDSYMQGVDLCVATPHCIIHNQDDISIFLKKRKKSADLLFEHIEDINGVPEIFLGAEVYLDNDLSRYRDIEKLCIGSSRYMLVELSGTEAINTAEWLYNLRLRKIKPIIAHIDRYAIYKEYLQEFADMDIVYQVNASRFLSIGGRKIIKNIMQYTDKFVVSSDMHNVTERKCNMQKAYVKARKKYSNILEEMFEKRSNLMILKK